MSLRGVVGGLIGFLCLVGTGSAGSGSPTETIAQESRAILHLLSTPGQLDQAWLHAERLLDFDEITTRALAAHWVELSLDQRWDARYLMGSFLKRVFMRQLGKLSQGDRLDFRGETVQGEYARVMARMVSSDQSAVEMVFLTRRTDAWRVYDIQVSGVSMLSNYRAQFNRLWQAGGWPRVQQALQAVE